MTKEEILDASMLSDVPDKPCTITLTEAYRAMEEYTKQQCIAYAHWLFKRILPHMTPQEAPAAEAENLYNKFLTETSI